MSIRKVRVLINPRSGTLWSPAAMQKTLQKYWDVEGVDLTFQFSNTAEDGQEKTRRAIAEAVDTILVIGGDGMVNSIGEALIGSHVALGVIPGGSGNGFARHFEIPLNPEEAAQALMRADRKQIDVGTANDHPFFVTCSMAWDAALVRSFDKSPVRGVIPYVFAGVYELLEYKPQPFSVDLDGAEKLLFKDPMVFTTANLTQYGGGAKIAPGALPDDGRMEMVVICKRDAPRIIANMYRLFDGTLDHLEEAVTRTFKTLDVHRRFSGPIQVDGELIDAPKDVKVRVLPRALTVLVPSRQA